MDDHCVHLWTITVESDDTKTSGREGDVSEEMVTQTNIRQSAVFAPTDPAGSMSLSLSSLNQPKMMEYNDFNLQLVKVVQKV